MARVQQITQPLIHGERLTRDEFMRRWESLPHVKRAELIGGVVHMPSPVSRYHGGFDILVPMWAGVYISATPDRKSVV